MSKEQRRVSFEKISGGARGLSALVGMSGLLSGGIAVFESANQAGTVGLLTVGGVSGLIALLGKVPLRWVVGGAEVDMSYDESVDTADALADMLTPDQLKELSRRLLVSPEASASAPSSGQLTLASTIERASEAESTGHVRMRRLATILGPGWSYTAERSFAAAGGRRVVPDGVLAAPGGINIALDVKAWGNSVSRSRLHQVVRRSREMIATVKELDAVLIMVDSDMPTQSLTVPGFIGDGESDSTVGFATFGDSRQVVQAEIERLHRAALKQRNTPEGQSDSSQGD